MPRPITATIHPEAVRHNLERVRQAVPDAKLWSVVKANAYGHGIENVFEGLRASDGFAMLDLDEAQRVRNLGWRGPILLLEGVFELRDLEICSRLSIWHAVHWPCLKRASCPFPLRLPRLPPAPLCRLKNQRQEFPSLI
jgi:alanine racemase